jgi:hypothetical protein
MTRIGLIIGAAMLLGASAPPAANLEASHQVLIAALRQDHVLVPGRLLLRASYVCSVKLGSAKYPIAEVLEQVPAAMEPRGVARVILLSPKLKSIWQAQLFGARPLFCQGNSVYFSGDVHATDGSSGNKVTFLFGGEAATITKVNPLKLPAPLETK